MKSILAGILAILPCILYGAGFDNQGTLTGVTITGGSAETNAGVVALTVDAGSSFPEATSGPGEYALIRTVGETTNDAWQIIRGQVSDYINASYTWTPWGVTNKFYANGTNDQTYTIPAGVTQVMIKCWGAGGRGYATYSRPGGSGGFTAQPLDITPGSILTLRVGLAATNTAGGWPGGGSGKGEGGGGGGLSCVLVETNLICVAGGGGGAAWSLGDGGDGGGLSGENGAYTAGGAGGTQTTPGAGAGFLTGGSSIASRGAGGGAGYYGGGRGGENSGGGGGSGYISTPEGTTFQGVITEDSDYESGIGVGGVQGGNGMIVILHNAPTE